MKQELKLLPTGDVEEVNRSLKEGFGGLGFWSPDSDRTNFCRSPLGLDPGAVSRVAHDNFHRVVSSDPIYCPWVSKDKVCGDGKEKCLPLREDGAVEARTVNESKNKF